MKKIYFLSLLVLCLSGCSEEAQPYKENNLTNPSSSETGYIQTH